MTDVEKAEKAAIEIQKLVIKLVKKYKLDRFQIIGILEANKAAFMNVVFEDG